MNAKAKGARAERRCIKHLEDLGWLCAKAGASLGMFDVVAMHPDLAMARFIQVKSGTNSLRRKERRALEDATPDSDCIFVEYWHWDREWTRQERFSWRTQTWTRLSAG